MRDLPSDPKEMADLLEAIARKIRNDPDYRAGRPVRGRVEVAVPAAVPEPVLGEIDIVADETHVTVTADTQNTDAASVHVSLSQGRLFIGLGDACRKDLALPVPVEEEGAYATFRNGILDIVLPRKDAPVRAPP